MYSAQTHLHEIGQQPHVDLVIIPTISGTHNTNETQRTAEDMDDSNKIAQPTTVTNSMSTLQKANTKKIGQTMSVELVKGEDDI
jgi:hypothetical protein